MPKIRRIAIRNFRSIESLEMDVADLTAMVGDNDSGKSNILRALNLFFNGETDPGSPLDFEVDFNRFVRRDRERRRRAETISIELTFDLPPNYHGANGQRAVWRKSWRQEGLVDTQDIVGMFRRYRRRGTGVWWEARDLPARSRVPLLLSRVQFEYVPAVRSEDVFRKLRARLYRVISSFAEGGFRDRSREFEHAIAEQVEALVQDISATMDDDTRLTLPDDLSQLFESLDFLSGDENISLDRRGDGIKGRYIPMILKFIVSRMRENGERGAVPSTFVWGYEEPENNLEFLRARDLANTFADIVREGFAQVLLTTHSPIFFNLADDDDKVARFIVKPDGPTGTKAESNPVGLGEKMGVMTVVAPYVRAAEEELVEMRAAAARFERELAERNRQNLPTVFVEGTTDRIIVMAAVAAFQPEAMERIFFAEPPEHGGFDYVLNNLRAWEYRNIHLPTAQRTRAVGIVDGDGVAVEACRRFDAEQARRQTVRHVGLPQPRWANQARRRGVAVPICLEETYPIEWWQEADEAGWLEDRPLRECFLPEVVEQLIAQTTDLQRIFHEADWAIAVRRRPAGRFKGEWARLVAAKDVDAVREGLPAYEAFVRSLVLSLHPPAR